MYSNIICVSIYTIYALYLYLFRCTVVYVSLYILHVCVIHVCISYVTSVRYVAGINHEARGRAVPEGRVIYPETYRTTDMT